MRWKEIYIQNVILKKGLTAHEKETYMRVDMLNSVTSSQQIFGAKKTKSISTP